jgi:hypothetical protein
MTRATSATAALWVRAPIWRASLILGTLSAILFVTVKPPVSFSLPAPVSAPAAEPPSYVSPIPSAMRVALTERLAEAEAARQQAESARQQAEGARQQAAAAQAAALAAVEVAREERRRAEADALAAREQARAATVARQQAEARQQTDAAAARAAARVAVAPPPPPPPPPPPAQNVRPVPQVATAQTVPPAPQTGLVAPNPTLPSAAEALNQPTGVEALRTSMTGAGEARIAGRTIPLPSGKFEPVSFSRSSYGSTSMYNVALASIDGNRLAAAVLVFSTPSDVNVGAGSRMFADCMRSDLHFLNNVANEEFGRQECQFVNHIWVDGWRAETTSPFFKAIATALEVRQVPLPPAMILSGFHFADRRGSMRVAYYFNPEIRGVQSSRTLNWDQSDWNKRYLARDGRKIDYIGELEAWTRDWTRFVKPAFEGGPALAPPAALANKFTVR